MVPILLLSIHGLKSNETQHVLSSRWYLSTYTREEFLQDELFSGNFKLQYAAWVTGHWSRTAAVYKLIHLTHSAREDRLDRVHW
jgi:hypothetical protein